MHPLWWLPIDLCHPWYTVVATLTGLSIPWCCPSMIYELFLCDDYHPQFLVICSLAAYHDGIYGQTMIACDTWQLTAKVTLQPNVFFSGSWRHEFDNGRHLPTNPPKSHSPQHLDPCYLVATAMGWWTLVSADNSTTVSRARWAGGIVLLEKKEIARRRMNDWQQVMSQKCVSVIRPIYLHSWIQENQTGGSKWWHANWRHHCFGKYQSYVKKLDWMRFVSYKRSRHTSDSCEDQLTTQQ